MAFKYAVVLTGGIATGKSTVAKFFLSEGFNIIDADKIAHFILDLHQDKIAELFGQHCVVDGKVARKELGKLIFANPSEKLRLEKLLHPLIFDEIERQSIELDTLKKRYIIDIPLFFESKGRYPIKRSIVVYTEPNIQLQRLMLRDGSTKIEAQQRIDSQLPIDEKRDLATYIIDNSKDLKNLHQESIRVKEKLLLN
ncbi:MAG: dephospho-CoA kinase [Sulfurovum sp.]|nr:MAG: dephospho-CoA kinase [Sulfurovum sp.]